MGLKTRYFSEAFNKPNWYNDYIDLILNSRGSRGLAERRSITDSSDTILKTLNAIVEEEGPQFISHVVGIFRRTFEESCRTKTYKAMLKSVREQGQDYGVRMKPLEEATKQYYEEAKEADSIGTLGFYSRVSQRNEIIYQDEEQLRKYIEPRMSTKLVVTLHAEPISR